MAMIDTKKHTKHISRMLYSNQNGAILIWLVLMMVVASIFGLSMVYLTTSSTQGKLFANSRMRAYYVAEAGGRFAVPQVAENPVESKASLDGETFSLGNNEQFTITVGDKGENNAFPLLIPVKSTSTVNEGTWLEASRTISYLVKELFKDKYEDQVWLGDNWTMNSHEAFVRATDQSGGA